MVGDVKHILLRAMAEPGYRELLFADFERAVDGAALDAAERASLRALSRWDFEREAGELLARLPAPIRVGRRVVVTPGR